MGFLPVFLQLYSFRVKGKKETHNCTPFVKWGVESPKATMKGIFYSSPVLTAGRVINQHLVVHGLYTHQGLKSFFQLHQAEDEVLFYSIYIPYIHCRIRAVFS